MRLSETLGELLLARMIGVDGVIAHHPIGSHARLDFPKVIEGHEQQMIAAAAASSWFAGSGVIKL